MVSAKEWRQKMVAKYCHAVALKVALAWLFLITSAVSNPKSEVTPWRKSPAKSKFFRCIRENFFIYTIPYWFGPKSIAIKNTQYRSIRINMDIPNQNHILLIVWDVLFFWIIFFAVAFFSAFCISSFIFEPCCRPPLLWWFTEWCALLCRCFFIVAKLISVTYFLLTD